jgi:branched-chain amino acid transport system ATP-binding protein
VILNLRSVDAGFGGMQVLHGVSFSLAPGEILALIGPNGAGKSTVLKSIFGLVRVWAGDILFSGKSIVNSKPPLNLRAGIALAPQGEKVFAGLSVRENLEVGVLFLNKETRAERLSWVLSQFPMLRDRFFDDAGKLSGGQQQMLALARALMINPKVLLLDEPSGGLAPHAATEVFSCIEAICSRQALAAIIVEHRLPSVLAIASHVCALKLGRIAFIEPTKHIQSDRKLLTDLFL